MIRRCLVSMNLDLFKMLNGGNEVDCRMAALKDEDFCLYHLAREMADRAEKSSRWEFRVRIEEPIS